MPPFRICFTLLLIITVPLVCTVLPARSLAAPVPNHLRPKVEPLYFPTRVGTKWVHVQGGKEFAYEVTKAEQQKDGSTVVTVAGGIPSPTRWSVSQAGLSVFPGEAVLPQLPAPLLKFPLPSNGKWELEGGLHSPKGLFFASKPEDVKVLAGTFKAVRVEVEWVEQGKATFWVAPGVGVVKTAGKGFEKEMKSFTLPEE